MEQELENYEVMFGRIDPDNIFMLEKLNLITEVNTPLGEVYFGAENLMVNEKLHDSVNQIIGIA